MCLNPYLDYDGLIRGYHGLHPCWISSFLIAREILRCMWDQDNYLWPWLHDLTPPRAVTHRYQHFNQQTRHSANYCSIMIILLMLANACVCFPLCCRVEACLCYYSSDDTTSSLVVSQRAHILSGVIRTILPRGGEDRTSIINFCLLENSSCSHEKNMLFPVLCGHSIIFLLAANLDLFINPSLHTFRLQWDKCMGTTLFIST